MKYFLRIFLIVFILIVGCSRQRVIKNLTVDEKIVKGNAYFDRGKYAAAKEFYESIVYDRTSVFTSTAQMKLADCYYHMNKFTEARFEYEELIRLFPDYKEIARAYFMLGVCDWDASLSPHYTQEETNNAKAAFELFVDKFPFDNKKDEALNYIKKCDYRLLEKKYWNGYAYYKIYDYSAAELYFNEILNVGLNDKIDRKSLYYSCRIHLARKDVEKSEVFFEKLQAKYPDAKDTRKIKTRLQRLRKVT